MLRLFGEKSKCGITERITKEKQESMLQGMKLEAVLLTLDEFEEFHSEVNKMKMKWHFSENRRYMWDGVEIKVEGNIDELWRTIILKEDSE